MTGQRRHSMKCSWHNDARAENRAKTKNYGCGTGTRMSRASWGMSTRSGRGRQVTEIAVPDSEIPRLDARDNRRRDMRKTLLATVAATAVVGFTTLAEAQTPEGEKGAARPQGVQQPKATPGGAMMHQQGAQPAEKTLG